MKLVSWNVNGLRACLKKGFAESAASLDADVICLTRYLRVGTLYGGAAGLRGIFNSAEKKGYSGTGVLSRVPMLSHTFGIGVDEHDHEGRVITCDFEDFYLVCCYTPQFAERAASPRLPHALGGRLPRLPEKAGRKKAGRPLRRPQRGARGDRLEKPQDQPLQRRFHRSGARQVFRTCWARGLSTPSATFTRTGPARTAGGATSAARAARNAGWRIDYFVVSQRLQDRLVSAAIHDQIMGSDHCPVELVLK